MRNESSQEQKSNREKGEVDRGLYKPILFLTGTIPAFIFALAGVAKIADPTDALIFLKSGLGVGLPTAQRLVPVLAIFELAIAVWLTYESGRSCRSGIGALALAGFFMGLLYAVMHQHPGSPISCGCFGALQSPLGGRSIRSHFVLDALLAGMLLIHVCIAHRYRDKRLAATVTSDSHVQST